MQEILEHKKKALAGLAGVLTIFIFVLTISAVVDIVNKIKHSKYIGQDAEFKNTIVVSDTGEVYAKPDLALLNFMVINEDEDVAQAMAENTERMNSVIKEMKSQGVEEKDLKTASYNIYPRYEYIKDNFGYSTGKRVLAGYEVFQSLEVKVRDLDKIGLLIEKGIASGANDVGNLQFTIDNQDELKKQARQLAIEKAKAKAQDLASQLGVGLGKITSFSENYYLPYYGTRDFAMEGGMGGAGEAPDIETGENKISVSIVITYEIY